MAAQQQSASAEPAETAMIREQLKTMGVRQYDSRVLDALLDLTYRSTSDILQDAEAINKAAGGDGSALTTQDIALAAQQHARLQPQPPSMQELFRLARQVNAQPLTGPRKDQHGIKLPPVADCLLSQNYQVKPRPKAAAPAVPPGAGTTGAAPGAPRQHFAVRQQHTLPMSVPAAGWQPPADAAGAAAQPFPPPAHAAAAAGQQQQAQQQQQQQQQQAAAAAMEVDGEDI